MKPRLTLACATLTALCLSTTALAGSTGAEWAALEAAHHGDLQAMLDALDAAPPLPQYRTNRSATELWRVLLDAGRFAELGLTPEEGRVLVEAVYARLGVPAVDVALPEAAGQAQAAVAGGGKSVRAGTEFEPVSAVLMRWPFDWSSQRDAWASMIEAVTGADATVYLWVSDAGTRSAAESFLRARGIDMGRVRFVVERTDSVWIRDYGPQFLVDTESDRWGMVDFHYKDSRPRDDETPLVIADLAGVPVVDRQFSSVVYTEGGNLNHDGLGMVAYSTRTYDRNPFVADDVIDQRLTSAVRAHQAMVLRDPSLDSTGHVDMFQKILDERRVLVGRYDSDEVDHAILEAAANAYATSTNGAGETWSVARIWQPDVYYIYWTVPVVRTYTNSLIVNDTVIVPTYGIPYDDTALDLYAALFPGKTIWPVDASTIIESGGAWHCVTSEVPNPRNPD